MEKEYANTHRAAAIGCGVAVRKTFHRQHQEYVILLLLGYVTAVASGCLRNVGRDGSQLHAFHKDEIQVLMGSEQL